MPEPTDIRSRPKKARKPQARTMDLRNAIAAIAAEYDRMSVRQLYYQLVARRVIEKTEQAYKRVVDISGQMRLDGSLDYRKIADGSRARRGVYAHSGLHEALKNSQQLYRRNYWINQAQHVEVWCEKDALTGVISPVCDYYGVTFVATRGFPSISLLYETAREIESVGKPATIFYFGDHDASGRQISDNLEADLRHFGIDITVERVALNPYQVRFYQLPTRPGKSTDSRHAAFSAEYGNAAVELDALPPNVLTNMVAYAIASQIDQAEWERAEEVERLERETFASLASINWEIGRLYQLTDDAA